MGSEADMDISPAERRKQRVRQSILDAAERVFAKEGESGLSIRRLAYEIDYSPAAIYKYFESKEALVDELKEAFFERILGLIETSRSSTEPFGLRARKCIEGYVTTALEKPNHYAAAFSGVDPFLSGEHDDNVPAAESHEASEFKGTKKGLAFAFLVEMIEQGQASGYLRDDLQPSHAAYCIWAACHGLTMIMIHMREFPPYASQGDAPSLDHIITTHADIVIRGLETAHSSGPIPLPSAQDILP